MIFFTVFTGKGAFQNKFHNGIFENKRQTTVEFQEDILLKRQFTV